MKFIENADAGPRAPFVILMVGGDGRAGLDDWTGGGGSQRHPPTPCGTKSPGQGSSPPCPTRVRRLGDAGLGRAAAQADPRPRRRQADRAHADGFVGGPVFVVGTSKGDGLGGDHRRLAAGRPVSGIVLTSRSAHGGAWPRRDNSPGWRRRKIGCGADREHADDACQGPRRRTAPLAQSLSPRPRSRSPSSRAAAAGEVCHPNHAHGFSRRRGRGGHADRALDQGGRGRQADGVTVSKQRADGGDDVGAEIPAGAALAAAVLFAVPARAEKVVTIPTRPGVTVKAIIRGHQGQSAGRHPAMGGDGIAETRQLGRHGNPMNNFVVRTRKHFARNGFLAVDARRALGPQGRRADRMAHQRRTTPPTSPR